MSGHLVDWLNLLLRWAHIVIAIGWIGTSFYFIALDLSLRRRAGMPAGIIGDAWQVHGGGFYHVQKYAVAPESLPPDLQWFRWEAYLTWVTGFALLAVIYYWNARLFLIDPAVLPLEPWAAIAISVASLMLGWLAYEALCRSRLGRNLTWLAIAVFALILFAAWAYGQVFSGRGMMIHVGAFTGTIMAANVFLVIIPNQRRMTAQLLAGETPDAEFGRIGKQRSTHNNYLTLPVVAFMISNHYPFLYARPHGWIVVAFIVVAGAMLRHFFNRHDAGDPLSRISWTLPVGAAALLVAAIVTRPGALQADSAQVSDARALEITAAHCITCHAAAPRHDAFDAPPAGVRLETVEELRAHAQRMFAQAVQSHAMPLGNETGMTLEERSELGAWIARQPEGAR